MTVELRDVSIPFRVLEKLGDPTLQRLKEDFPRFDGTTASAKEAMAPKVVPPGASGDQFLGNAWAQALRSTVARATDRARTSKAHLVKANRLELLINILSAVSASTLLALVAGNTSQASQIIAAGITLVAVVLGLINAYLRKPLGEGSRFDEYVKLNAAVAEGKVLEIHLQAWAQAEPPRAPLGEELEQRIHDLVLELEKLIGLS